MVKNTLTHIVGKYFALRKKTSKGVAQNNKVLVVSLHKLGDTVFTIPAVESLMNAYGKENISILCFAESVPIYRLRFPQLTYYPVKPSDFCFGTRIASVNAASMCRTINAEIVVDITGSITSASIIRSTHAALRVGMNSPAFAGMYDKFITVSDQPHLMDRYLKVTKLLTDNAQQGRKEFPISYDKSGTIYIHPFAGWGAKQWEFEKFLELAALLSTKYNISLLLPPNYVTLKIEKQCAEANIPFAISDSIDELINYLSNAALIIGCDSGPIYIASLLGKPTYTIYGPTNPEYSQPFGAFHKTIRKKIECSPTDAQYCFLDAGRSCKDWQCIKRLSVQEVHEHILPFLNTLNLTTISEKQKQGNN